MKSRLPIILLWLFLYAGLVSGQSGKGQSGGQQSKPNFSGTWVFDADLTRRAKPKQFTQPDKQIELAISHRESELKIERKVTGGGKEQTQEFVYYNDGRGESNPNPTMSLNLNDAAREVKSVTRWKNDKLVIVSSIRAARQGGFYRVDIIDKWELSADGQTLTQTTAVASEKINTIGLASVPAIIIPFGGELKKVYRRTSD